MLAKWRDFGVLKKRKTLWETEKMLVGSIFSFTHNVFEVIVFRDRYSKGPFGEA